MDGGFDVERKTAGDVKVRDNELKKFLVTCGKSIAAGLCMTGWDGSPIAQIA
jgi:hypothetical protein